MQRDDERPPAEPRDCGREQPVRVDEIRRARRTPHRPPHREKQQGRQPGPATEVRRHAAAVGEAVVPVSGTRREHLHLQTALAQPLHGIGDEAARELPLVPRPRRREDDDAHLRRRLPARPAGEHDRQGEREGEEGVEVIELEREVEEVGDDRPDQRRGEAVRERPHVRAF